MNNKKVWLTVLFAAILALVFALVLLKTNKTTTLPKTEKILQNKESIIPETSEKETLIKEKKSAIPAKTELHKIHTKPEQQTEKISPKSTKTKSDIVIPKLEVKIEENNTTEQKKINPKDFEVPIQYTSENTYKYVYTPARYKK